MSDIVTIVKDMEYPDDPGIGVLRDTEDMKLPLGIWFVKESEKGGVPDEIETRVHWLSRSMAMNLVDTIMVQLFDQFEAEEREDV